MAPPACASAGGTAGGTAAGPDEAGTVADPPAASGGVVAPGGDPVDGALAGPFGGTVLEEGFGVEAEEGGGTVEPAGGIGAPDGWVGGGVVVGARSSSASACS